LAGFTTGFGRDVGLLDCFIVGQGHGDFGLKTLDFNMGALAGWETCPDEYRDHTAAGR